MKKLMLALLVAMVAAGSSFAGVVYVKPAASGTGDGSSWANAMGSVSNALVQALKTSAPCEVRMAKGVHKWLSEMGVGRDVKGVYDPAVSGSYAFSIRGGYAGVAEDEAADAVANPTYLSFDANGDDRWVKRSLTSLATTGSSTTTDCGPMVDNGTVVFPDDSADPDALYSIDTSKVSDNSLFLYLQDNSGVVELSDFTILGSGNTKSYAGKGSTFIQTVGAAGVKMKNVTFLGAYVGNSAGLTSLQKPENATILDNVRLYWSHVQGSLWGMGGCKGSTLNMTVKGLYCAAAISGGGCVIPANPASAGCTFRDCTFEKCYANQSQGAYRGQATIFGCEQSYQVTFTNCVFRNIRARGNNIAGVLSFRFGGLNSHRVYRNRVIDCLFEDNTCHATGKDVAVQNLGLVALSSDDCSLEGCTFRNNRIVVKPTGSSPVAEAAVVTVTHRADKADPYPRRAIVNCTFAGNAVEAEAGSNDGTTTPRKFARSVLVNTIYYDCPLDVVIAGCSFLGTASAYPDVLWTGKDTTYPVQVVNCLFQGNSVDGYVPFATDASGQIAVNHCLMNGCAALPTGVVGADNVFVDVPVGDWDDLDGVRTAPVIRPAARFPALRSGVSLGAFVKDNALYLADADGAHLYQTATAAVPAAVPAFADALGAARPDGDATIGAVQTLTDKAENGATLFVSVSPVGTGTLAGGDAVQVVEKGECVSAITAASVDPARYAFVGWKRPDGSVYSTDLTLTIASLQSDLQLTASFSAPKTKYTFDLGPTGTFDESGKSCETLEFMSGEAVAVPAFTIDEAHYQPVGWSPAVPSTAGTSDQTFTYQAIAKVHRIVRVDLNLASGGDGSSWTAAMTNLQEAIDLAAQWTGEVWVRQGVHYVGTKQADSLHMARNVQILGGFEGADGTYPDVDAERAARNPDLYRSVISGDWDRNDVWTCNSQYMKDENNKNVPVVQGGLLYEPEYAAGQNFYGTTEAWQNVYNIFDNATVQLDESAVLDGLTLVGARNSAVSNGADARPLIRNCTFLGAYCRVTSSTTLTISNCLFKAIDGGGNPALWFQGGTKEGTHGVVRNCRFRYCHGGGRGLFAFSTNPGYFELRDTLFEQCTGSSAFNVYNATIIGCEWGEGVIAGVTVRNCWNKGIGNLVLFPKNATAVSNCLFEGNAVYQNVAEAAVSTGDSPLTLVGHADKSFSCFLCNTTFRSNTVERHVGNHANSKDGNACVFYGLGNTMLANCTFDGNAVTCVSPVAAYPAKAGTILHRGERHLGVVQTTVNGNTAADGDIAIVGRTGTTVARVVNSILWGGTGHVAATRTGETGTVAFWNSVVHGLDASAPFVAEAIGCTAASPQLSRKWFGTEPVVARRVAGGSSAQRLGRNVYVDGGVVCIPTDAEETTFVNAQTGAAAKPSADKTMLADVFGLARPVNKATAGALQETGCGLAVVVR